MHKYKNFLALAEATILSDNTHVGDDFVSSAMTHILVVNVMVTSTCDCKPSKDNNKKRKKRRVGVKDACVVVFCVALVGASCDCVQREFSSSEKSRNDE
jgi:hypothetical protein